MKQLLTALVIMQCAISSFAQMKDPATMTFDELYMYMKTDRILEQMYFSTTDEIAKNIDLYAKEAVLTAPIVSEQNAQLALIKDSLGLTEADFDKYNPNPPREKIEAYEKIASPIMSYYSGLTSEATKELRTQYKNMIQTAFYEAAKRYYDNLNQMSNK
jgi:hypothetical protein